MMLIQYRMRKYNGWKELIHDCECCGEFRDENHWNSFVKDAQFRGWEVYNKERIK